MPRVDDLVLFFIGFTYVYAVEYGLAHVNTGLGES